MEGHGPLEFLVDGGLALGAKRLERVGEGRPVDPDLATFSCPAERTCTSERQMKVSGGEPRVGDF
jgi:hypothetical protein